MSNIITLIIEAQKNANQKKLHEYYERSAEGNYWGSKSGMMKIQGLCYGRKNGDWKTISEYTKAELYKCIENEKSFILREEKQLTKGFPSWWYSNVVDKAIDNCKKEIARHLRMIEVIKEEIAKREEEEVATEKATSQTLKTIRYEWIYLDVDCNGDIQNLDATENFCKAANESIEINDDWASKTVCLQKTYLDTFGYATDETRSYYDSGYLQTTFEDGSKVPTRYIKEVDQWFQRNS
jgi:hypothetical protein